MNVSKTSPESPKSPKKATEQEIELIIPYQTKKWGFDFTGDGKFVVPQAVFTSEVAHKMVGRLNDTKTNPSMVTAQIFSAIGAIASLVAVVGMTLVVPMPINFVMAFFLFPLLVSLVLNHRFKLVESEIKPFVKELQHLKVCDIFTTKLSSSVCSLRESRFAFRVGLNARLSILAKLVVTVPIQIIEAELTEEMKQKKEKKERKRSKKVKMQESQRTATNEMDDDDDDDDDEFALSTPSPPIKKAKNRKVMTNTEIVARKQQLKHATEVAETCEYLGSSGLASIAALSRRMKMTFTRFSRMTDLDYRDLNIDRTQMKIVRIQTREHMDKKKLEVQAQRSLSPDGVPKAPDNV